MLEITQWRRFITLIILIFTVSAASFRADAVDTGAQKDTRISRAYIDGAWGQMHVRVAGPKDGAAVILLHKMVWSSVEFEKVQPLLAAAGIRSIAVDIPGYGLSDGPDHEPTAADYANALLPVLDYYHLAKAAFLGVDSGATIVTAFADQHPERVTRLIIDGPPLFDAATTAKLLQEPEFDRTPQPGGAEFTRRWNSVQASIAPGSLSLEAMHTGELQFFEASPSYLYGHHAIFKYDLLSALKRIKVPTALVNAKGGLQYKTALDIKQHIRPDFDYVELDWPGMMVSFDDPQPWAAAVAKLVASDPK
jgi:pimeloyl-ACP methyl ester carboxylesterase